MQQHGAMLLSNTNGGFSGGDGNLTQVSQEAGSGDLRSTANGYDYRNRKIFTIGELDFCEAYTYDNAGRLLQTDRRDGTPSGTFLAAHAGVRRPGAAQRRRRNATSPMAP